MEFEPWKPGNQANRWLSRYGAGWPSGWAGWRYSPSSMGYSAIRPSRIIASPGDQLKSHILLAISARVARKFNYSQEDIALVEDLLDRGADPNYRGRVLKFDDKGVFSHWLIASPFCEFLAEILQANLLFCHEAEHSESVPSYGWLPKARS